ncbi:UDP-glucosyltransferase 2-like [Schistocerca cancellata]|uniref:UDP-glucosyltransferase 2-like n=1 Tax=Schistocerca cancellata TaxID=274614 RepID=UPI002117CF63|nr:UDP-glucosyltransferase 2-like [Schistocerca cancellata]
MKLRLLLLPLLVQVCSCARILGINPTPSISHQLPFLIIMRALAEKGHQVTIITTNPMKDPPPNVTQIDMSYMYDKWKKDVNFYQMSQLSRLEMMEMMIKLGKTDCDSQLKTPSIKELQFQREFDLVIMEMFLYMCYFGLVHKLGHPPVVGFWSAELFPQLHRMMGNPINPAYFPDIGDSYTDHMTFWERVVNAYHVLDIDIRITSVSLVAPQDEVMRAHFGNDCPSTGIMQYNLSLLLANSHFCSGYPLPMQPNVIQMTGLHIKGAQNPLPKDIQSFLDGAKHGFIYFSLGSNVKSNTLPEVTREALMAAFSELPQRVLWKFEDDTLPGKPSNVMISKWLPQEEVLAHTRIRLFITQGGLQSFNEASYYGVPLIGIPFFGDQGYNVAKMVSAGIGVKLDFKLITKESTLEAVRTVLENPSYRENMRRFSAIYREHQSTSLENALWWVEYVIRHRGAPHLRPAALDLAWWQLLLLDVIGFVVAAAAAVSFVLYKLTRRLLALICRPSKLKKQ